jgi:signal transduction histidine kinase
MSVADTYTASSSLAVDMALFPEMNPGPVCRMDRSGKVLLANSKAKSFFGDEQLAGKNWRTILTVIDDATWESIIAADRPFAIEEKIGDVWMSFAHVVSPDRDQVFVYGTDITHNKEIEQQIAEIARFPDMNPGPVLRTDPTGCILLSNAAATKVFGENLVGQNWLETCVNIDDKKWKEILNSTEVIPIEARIGQTEFVFHHRRDFKTDLVFIFGSDVTLQKLAERQLRQSEKMATLGTLAAGVAHELNNPAAAVRRSALLLKEAFQKLREVYTALTETNPTVQDMEIINALEDRIERSAGEQVSLDSIQRSDLEAEMEGWMDEHGVQNAWQFAPLLVSSGFAMTDLETASDTLSPNTLPSAIAWVAALQPVFSLMYEIAEGSSRISEIVVAMKGYSYLGQAPVQNVDVHEGLDNTLVILRNKLKLGITVNRDYAEDLPAITAYGSELNQVWTNILDNAADAMQGKGEITIRTKRIGDFVAVEIEDNGPGIPDAVQSQIFDPFFTTKPPGKGTGLGLATTYGIVTEKHKGTISVNSRPGSTVFQVRLPIHGVDTQSI